MSGMPFTTTLRAFPTSVSLKIAWPRLCGSRSSHGTRTALLMVDLNGFKLINDTHGHDIGDELLRHIVAESPWRDSGSGHPGASRGRRVHDHRHGPPADQPADVIAAASVSRIAQALRKPVGINGNALTVTGSIGVAIYPDDTTDEVLLRRLADQRMYEQKRQIPLDF